MFVVLWQAVVGLILIYIFGHDSIRPTLIVWSTAVFLLVLFGSYNTKFVGISGKDPRTGRIDMFKAALFFPYYVVVLFLMIGGKCISKLKGWSSYNEISSGIYIGDYYSSFVSDVYWKGIVDLTNELPRFSRSNAYQNLQSWDGCPPAVDNIQKAVEFIRKCQRPVLVHCAYV
jgi:hypothetical protein